MSRAQANKLNGTELQPILICTLAHLPYNFFLKYIPIFEMV